VVANVQRVLSEQHDDTTLLVNAVGFFTPKAFVEYQPLQNLHPDPPNEPRRSGESVGRRHAASA
jgi:hypothetical protein